MSEFEYPEAVDPDMVGEYPAVVDAGAGYFYDEVLEYRVWCYPAEGAEDIAEGSDYFFVFPTFEEAEDFRKQTKGAQPVLALICQYEWIDEIAPGQFRHETGQRIAEWGAELLEGRERQEDSIDQFFKDNKLEKA